MNKKNYQLINNITAWVVFLIAAITYISTAEPTASFWDCGEFIAAGYKLEVGHPPGAPLFLLIARFFTLFAFGDVTKVAFMVNLMSALSSAFTILFLFWTITHIARKVVIKSFDTITQSQVIRVMGAGVVGALAYTFSDSFWFSAVEGEVYAMSSLFTAVVFWLILKWESVADEPHSNRWLIVIALLMGLSIGVHLLNLLCIPAIVFVFYFKKYKVDRNGIIYASLAAIGILGVMMYGIIPYSVKFASWFEFAFVNWLGAPFHTGTIFYLLALFGGLFAAIYYTHQHGKALANLILLSVTAVMIGYSTYTVIVVRANADTPMDENNPDNAFSLLSYLNREQYGDRPLSFGQYYNSPVIKSEDDKPTYSQINGEYKVTNHSTKQYYAPKTTTFFPRMYSSQSRHVKEYQKWSGHDGTNGKNVVVKMPDGKERTVNKPRFSQNLKFFFDYQLDWMYFRYFMWNFAGRQNESQGHGDKLSGNWLSGIKFIDEARLGSQDNLPSSITNDKSRNTYYMLPLLLGILGIFFLFKESKKDSFVVALLFILTGVAIVVYLNQTPLQPRERDYAYVGSFYAFAIWIGLGVLSVHEMLNKLAKNSNLASIIATVVCLLAVPTIMAAENYDDHDRSNLYTARDFSRNYLMSCEKDGILFTNGDNDTFPLWYMQEVEGVRTDLRVCNLSLLQTDWYIDQMKRKAYESEALPISMVKEQYIQGTRDVVPIYERIKQPIDINLAMKFVKSDDDQQKVTLVNGEKINYFPNRTFILPVNKNAIIENNKELYNDLVVKEDGEIIRQPRIKDESQYLDKVEFKLTAGYIAKNHLAVLDMLNENKWERPIYFANLMSNENYLGLTNHFQADGLTYRLVPFKTKPASYNMQAEIDPDILYKKFTEDFTWGGLDKGKDVFLNENNVRMVKNHQNLAIHLANALVARAKSISDTTYLQKAVNVLDKIVQIAPNHIISYNQINMLIAEAYYNAGAFEKGDRETKILADVCLENINYYKGFKKYKKSVESMKGMNVSILYTALQKANSFGRKELVESYNEKFKIAAQ